MEKEEVMEVLKEEYCICGNHNHHTRECKRNMTFQKMYKRRRELWAERVKKHLCGDCGIKIKPKTIYPSRCESCNKKSNKKNLKSKKD